MSMDRALVGFPAVAAQALLGWAFGYYLGGAVTATVGACLAAGGALAILLRARGDAGTAVGQLVLASILTALHLAALYTLGDDGFTPFLDARAQLALAGLLFAGCTALAVRLRLRAAMKTAGTPPAPAAVVDDDPTLELAPAATPVAPPVRDAIDVPPLAAIPSPRLRSPLALGVVSCALFIVATLFWLGDDTPHELAGAAVARELPSPTPRAGAAASIPTDGTDEAATPPVPEPLPAEPETDGASSPPQNALAPSAARRECMAQIESARLFQQLARQAATPEQYTEETQAQIARMLKSKPVGPRTLNRIAERMWEARESDDRPSGWWANQFSRCEAARSGGSWYVVRG